MKFNLGSQGDILTLAANEITATKRFTVANNVTIEAPSTSGGAILKLENTDTSVSSTDYLGKLQFISNDDSNSASGIRASIDALVQGDSGATGLIFSTASNLDQTAIERLRIDASGNISFQSGAFVVECDGISINNDDNLRLLFSESGVFKAGLQVATTADDMITGSAVNDFCIRSNFNMLFAAGSVERLRIDSSGNSTFAGNVGIGITPSASFSGVEVLQLGKGMTIFGNTNDDRATMASNLILNTGTAFEYVMDGLAGKFSIEDGNMSFGTAPLGDAGDVATITERFAIANTGNATFAGSVALTDGVLESFNAQPMYFYSTTTTLNYELLAIDKQDAGNARLRVYKSGSGSYRGLEFHTNGSATLTLDTSQNATFAGSVNTGRLFVEQSGADIIDMTRTGVGTYRFAISGSDAFSLFDVGANADRLIIDSSGRVGIGMTPSDYAGYMLQINGTTQAFMSFGNSTTGTGALNGLIIGNDGTGADIYQREAQPLRFHTNNTERLRIDSSGNVKVGRSAGYGNSRIQSFIDSTANFATPAYLAADSTNMAQGVGGEISFIGKYATGVDDYAFYGGIKGFKENATSGNTACALGFYTRPTGTLPSERMRISSDGKVTIGNTASVQPLTVAGNVLFRTTTADGFENRFQFITGGSGDAGNFYVYNASETPTIRLNSGGDSYFNLSLIHI